MEQLRSSTSRSMPLVRSRTSRSLGDWKAKFGGMTVSDAQRLKALEAENARLKRLLAESMLDNAALKDVLGRKW